MRSTKTGASADMTSFYYHGWSVDLKLTSDETELMEDEKQESNLEDADMLNDKPKGFVGIQIEDILYEEVIDYYRIFINFEDWGTEINRGSISEFAWNVKKNLPSMFRVREEYLPAWLKTEIILSCQYRNIHPDVVAVENGISKSQVQNVIYEFKAIKRASKRNRKISNLRRWKLTHNHLEALNTFTNHRLEQGFTLSEARSYLLAEFPSLKNVALSTLSLALKKNLRLSYKKLGLMNITKASHNSKTNLLSWVKWIIGLIEEGFHLIFLDEFLINRNTTRMYGWTRMG